MTNATIDKLAWVLIYAGMFVAGLGIWYLEHSAAVGWTLALGGGGLVAIAAYLIWLRSRRSQ
jgi:cyanate permease